MSTSGRQRGSGTSGQSLPARWSRVIFLPAPARCIEEIMRRFFLAQLLWSSPPVATRAATKPSTTYFTYDPRSLDPALSTDVPTGEVVSLLFDNLTQFDPDAQLKPGLAPTLGDGCRRAGSTPFTCATNASSTMAVRSRRPTCAPRSCARWRRAAAAAGAGPCTPSRAPGRTPPARPRTSRASSCATIPRWS